MNALWGCMGCVGMVPTQNLELFPSPWKGSFHLHANHTRSPRIPTHPHPIPHIFIFFHLSIRSSQRKILWWYLSPSKILEVSIRPHSKVWPSVAQWERVVARTTKPLQSFHEGGSFFSDGEAIQLHHGLSIQKEGHRIYPFLNAYWSVPIFAELIYSYRFM